MEKINISELLKDCPSGMELDSTLLEGLEFDSIVDSDYLPIRCRIKNPNGGYNVYNFTKHGCWFDSAFAKCLIFPKGKTTWEGFHRPFKDGDILVHTQNQRFVMSIYHKEITGFIIKTHCILWDKDEGLSVNKEICCYPDNTRLATEEEKAKLFQAIKDNGYCWNAETKTLEKLPRFKVGDRIRKKGENSTFTITDVNEAHYFCGKYVICDTCDNNWELVPNKFDINTLKPFDKVLVKTDNERVWSIQFFERVNKVSKKTFVCMGGYRYRQCVPYEGNEHLLDTTNDCGDFYKTWEK